MSTATTDVTTSPAPTTRRSRLLLVVLVGDEELKHPGGLGEQPEGRGALDDGEDLQAPLRGDQPGDGRGAGLAAYGNAYAIWILPHSLVTLSLTTAMLPAASRMAAAGDLPAHSFRAAADGGASVAPDTHAQTLVELAHD